MKPKWIITGANGYLGGNLCLFLHGIGETVIGLVREGRTANNLSEKGIDVDVYENVSSCVSKNDIFVHCAGKVGNSGLWDNFIHINCTWSVSLFEKSQINRAGCFVYISSIAALGYKNRGNCILDENSSPMHVDGEYYGKSKFLAEKKLLETSKKSSTRLLILRPGLIYGNRAFSSSQTWLRRGFIVDSTQKIPLTHITNFAHALIKLVELTKGQGVFVVVDDEQPEITTLNELKIRNGLLTYHPWRIGKSGYMLLCMCRLLYRLIQRRFDRSLINQIIADYYFQTRRLTYSTKKLRSEADWMPAVRLEDSLSLSSPNKEK